MPYSSNYVYTTINGTFGPSSAVLETWKAGFKIPLSSAPSTAALTSYLTAISTAVQTFHTSGGIRSGTNCFLTFLTAAHLGTDGKYTGGGAQTTTTFTYGAPIGGANTTVLPLSTACVLSLRTQFARGLASHGRIYYPMTGQTLGTDGLISGTQQTAIANAAKTLLDAINGAAAAQLSTSNKVSVMSNVGSGTLAPVLRVLVGAKPDRQERRERSQAENYVTGTLASTLSIGESLLDVPVDRLPGGVGVRPRD